MTESRENYDIAILGSAKDLHLIQKLRLLLKKLLPDGEELNIATMDNPSTSLGRIHHYNELIKNSKFCFLLISNNFIEDKEALVLKHLAMEQILHYPNNSIVVPIFTELPSKNYFDIPGLNNIRGISLPILLRGQTLDNLHLKTIMNVKQSFVKGMYSILRKLFCTRFLNSCP